MQKINTLTILLIFLCLFLASCMKSTPDKVQIYISNKMNLIHSSEWLELVEVIQLDTNEECFLSDYPNFLIPR